MDKDKIISCQEKVGWKDQFGFHAGYCECVNPAKYEVKFNDGIRPARQTMLLCGLHLRAIDKKADRLIKMGYNPKLEIKKL